MVSHPCLRTPLYNAMPFTYPNIYLTTPSHQILLVTLLLIISHTIKITSPNQTPRLVRLTIKLYKGQARQGGEGHDFARDYVVKAAKHGIYKYQQVDTTSSLIFSVLWSGYTDTGSVTLPQRVVPLWTT